MATPFTQAPSAIVMVRPHRFSSNPETSADNLFQRQTTSLSPDQVRTLAHDEVTKAAQTLQSNGVRVHLFEDYGDQDTPDSVFPNNWFSTHPGGHVALYPMYSLNRRRERRTDVIEMLKASYRVQDVIDYSGLEFDHLSLEGTGAMVLDHLDRVAYTANSNRANPIALERFCTHFNYEPMAFDAYDRNKKPVYHTNVLMSICTEFCMVGLISDPARRAEITQRLQQTGRTVIDLSDEQIQLFAGNTLEISSQQGQVLALSTTAYHCLTKQQKSIIEQSARLLPLSIPTIELAGGSVRCMLAGIHLAPRL